MLNIERVIKNDRLMRALTGFNRDSFEALLPQFAAVYHQIHLQTTAPRQRAIGGGRKANLRTMEEKLLFILFYFKCYPTFDLASILFDLDRGQANRWMHRLQAVLEATLEKEMVLPERKLNSLEAFIERFPEVKKVMIDGTERPIQRPKDPQQQKATYSGKKRRHTRKHLAMTTPDKRVLVLSPAERGTMHDKRLLDEQQMATYVPDEVPIHVDLGFQGLQNEYDNIVIPHKKPRGGELSEQQKQENRQRSQERVVCEHAFAGIKRYGAVSAVYRNRKPDFDDRLMVTATGLWNFYLIAA